MKRESVLFTSPVSAYNAMHNQRIFIHVRVISIGMTGKALQSTASR